MRIENALLIVTIATVAGSLSAPAARCQTGTLDGPAELPRAYVSTALANSPSPGKSVQVRRGDDLQRALDHASCGDTLRLDAGAQWAGIFRLPAKSCDDQHWITIRTSAEDAALPAESKRLTPCYAGAASLPGRPEYVCPSPQNVLARLVMDQSGSGPVVLQNGANHYRLIGLEITRAIPSKVVYNLIAADKDGGFNHLTLDRVWVHGTAQDETVRGLMLTGATYVAVVDSYFSDFHCVAVTGACVDAQAIAGGLGDRPSGTFEIANNFLEASGENILFGGGEATQTPTDIAIRRNHFFKPLNWQAGAAGFIGGDSGRPFIVKNLLELKNAERVLIEGNVMENVWGGFSQGGFAILLTPKNQNGHCPPCKVNDVTVRLNQVRRMASGMQIAAGLSDAGAASAGAARISVHDNVLDEIDAATYKGSGVFAQISSNTPPLHDLNVSHNTAFPSKALFIIGGQNSAGKMSNFSFADNLFSGGDTDIISTGGGPANCAFQPAQQGPSGVLRSCFSSHRFSGNVIAGSKGKWPEGNFTPSDAVSAGVSDFHNGSAGNYRLCRDKGDPHPSCKKASPYLHTSSDGKPAGADLDAVKAAIEGVE